MAIEVAPKKEERPLWQTLLFYLSFVLLVLSLLLYLFLEVFFLPKLQKDIDAVSSQINEEDKKFYGDGDRSKTIGEIINDVKKTKTEVDDFRNFYNNSSKTSAFFSVFEGMVHPKVYFDSFSLKIGEKETTVSLSGETEGYESLIQQIEVIKSQPAINSFDVSNIVKSGEGTKVKFNLLLNPSQSIFRRDNKI